MKILWMKHVVIIIAWGRLESLVLFYFCCIILVIFDSCKKIESSKKSIKLSACTWCIDPTCQHIVREWQGEKCREMAYILTNELIINWRFRLDTGEKKIVFNQHKKQFNFRRLSSLFNTIYWDQNSKSRSSVQL